MKIKNILLLIIIIQLLLISFDIQAADPIKFVSLEKTIEIIKLSSTRNTTGYSATNIFNYGIEFYVNNEKIRDFKLVRSTFKSHVVDLTNEQLTKINTFIGFVSENPKEYRNLKFNLIDVLNNLQFMDTFYTEINFIEKEKLIEIIKLSGDRERKGYKNVKQVFRNEIVFFVDKQKVVNINDFPLLFKNNNIELTEKQISDIHNFIGFISENPTKYKELKFNLMDVYNNLNYMGTNGKNVEQKKEIITKTKTVDDKTKVIEIIKLSTNRERKGYNGSLIWKNKIEFFVDNYRVNDLNEFPILFNNIKINLNKEEISNIHNFIGFISENSAKYKNIRFNLVDVYNNLNYMTNKFEEIANQNNGIIDKILEKLVNFNPEKGFDGSILSKNNIKLYVKNHEVYNLSEFNNQFLKINLDLNILERYKIYSFINYIANNVNQFKDNKFDLYYVYEKYAKSGDSFNDVAKIKSLYFINNNDYELKVFNESNVIIEYIYTNIKYSNDQILKIESKIVRDLDNIKCNKATPKKMIDLYGKPTKVILSSNGNSIHVNYMYGELFLYFGNQDKLIEKRFLLGYGITEIKFAYQGKIKIGSTLEEVINYFGNPKTIIDGKPNDFQDDVLYKNIDGKKGCNYICYKSKRIRIFFDDDKVSTLILID